LEIQYQDLEAIRSASTTLHFLVVALDKRTSTIEAATAEHQKDFTALNTQLLEVKLLLQRLNADFEDQEAKMEERAKEARQLSQNLKGGIALFLSTSLLCFLGVSLFPNVSSQQKAVSASRVPQVTSK
jgi:hypothetical protein